MTADNKKGDNGEAMNNEACRKGHDRRFTLQEIASIIQTVECLMQRDGMTRQERCAEHTNLCHALA
jgi:hypothetical protein